jgi:phosphoglycolate phosphatase-like HAD superfamily hydrolase
MTIRLVAFDLDGTLIRGRNSLAVIGAGLGHPEWEKDMEILYMRDETPEQMRRRVAPWSAFSPGELCGQLVHSRLAPGVEEGFRSGREHRSRGASDTGPPGDAVMF